MRKNLMSMRKRRVDKEKDKQGERNNESKDTQSKQKVR